MDVHGSNFLGFALQLQRDDPEPRLENWSAEGATLVQELFSPFLLRLFSSLRAPAFPVFRLTRGTEGVWYTLVFQDQPRNPDYGRSRRPATQGSVPSVSSGT